MSRLLILRGQDRQLIDAFNKQPITDVLQPEDCVYLPDGFNYPVFDILRSTQSARPRFLVCDSGFLRGDEVKDYPVLYIPDLKYGIQHYVRSMVRDNMPVIDICDTDRNFNFSVNIYRLDRILMMKLISWFDLIPHCRYRWRGQGANCDMTPVLRDMKKITAPWLTKQFKNHVLAPVTGFTPQWVEVNDVPVVRDYGILPNSQLLDINDAWVRAIKPLMEHTAISVICESSSRPDLPFFQFSEKTMAAMVSATFPIWVGNYGQAELMSEFGFDVFSDVIDHSYQHRPTLLERCYHALADNIELLRHPTLAKDLRKKHWDRLLENQDRFLKRDVLGKYIIQQARKLPAEIQERLVFKDDGCVFPEGSTGC